MAVTPFGNVFFNAFCVSMEIRSLLIAVQRVNELREHLVHNNVGGACMTGIIFSNHHQCHVATRMPPEKNPCMERRRSEQKIAKLKTELSPEKVCLVEKYQLVPDERLIWGTHKENTFPRRVFKHQFLLTRPMLDLVFRLYELCGAKLKYFREHFDQYEPTRYDMEEGFVPTELWDMEFLKHVASGRYLDFRYLQRMTKIQDFHALCGDLETFEERGEVVDAL
jgi:hypothetical protein